MSEITRIVLIIDIGFVIFFISERILFLFICSMLAIINSNAVYDEIAKRSILKLAKEDKIWETVSKMLKLEEENK